ncbi:TetR/AcrR family transcriptional regulator [Nonomuraea basaltis]|uniref:TetR/AcrR family transcriptional regulator n=1 Tax=Nonomuraea basaltis TaxID=2495887 RepID=UPI00110C4296|nr:TetR/AcrR family transcriptional regulator [Nonomuraea basaltis]TMR93786.1 TetR/AcrR family transcriptional regulator [Nonomuraea basaltis]
MSRSHESTPPLDPLYRNRAPRERILSSAAALFYHRGIHATSVSDVTSSARVSKRTLYEEFKDKDEIIAAYLAWCDQAPDSNERALEREDLPPRERLIALFDPPSLGAQFRGCPFHNAAVEIKQPRHPAQNVILAHKQEFRRRLLRTAHEADARDPEELASQLFVLFEGATALATSLGDIQAFDFAKSAALMLIREGLHPGAETV